MPEFRIDTRNADDTTVVVLEGELDVSSAPTLREHLSHIDAERSRLVIDLRGLRFVDSSGLRALLAANEAAEAAGQEFAVVRGPSQIDRLLRITRVAEQLTLLDDLELPAES